LEDDEWTAERTEAINFVRTIWKCGFEIRIQAGLAAPELLDRQLQVRARGDGSCSCGAVRLLQAWTYGVVTGCV
jgi:hypothetical protein